jgi:putative transposase
VTNITRLKGLATHSVLKEISEKVGLSRIAIGRWRKRYSQKGLEGLHDELRPGRPRSVSDEKVAELIHKTVQSQPEGETHWSTRTMASEVGVSHMPVCRVWRTFGLKPHLRDTFKLSTDQFVKSYNRDSKPFIWTATAESIFEKLERLCNVISVTKH